MSHPVFPIDAVHVIPTKIKNEPPKDTPITEGKLFRDNHFPANVNSIGEIDEQDLIPDIEWLRPSKFLNRVQLYEDGIEPGDIKQGALGDCYFLGALAGLAETPQRLKRLIKKTGNGRYQITFYKGGIKQYVVIDDLIPCVDGEPVFSKNHGNEIWVLLLEKAYAKLHGSYAAIEGGLSAIAFSDLTGMPVDKIDTKKLDTDDLFEKLEGLMELEWTTCTSINGNFNANETKKNYGLVTGHAYTILGAQEYKGIKLVKLRNPWGNFEWKGQWSDNDPNWTPELKKAFGFKKANDGIFFMSIEHFKHFFDSIEVLDYEDDWLKCYGGYELYLTKRKTYFILSSSAEVSLTYYQRDTTKPGHLRVTYFDMKGNKIGGREKGDIFWGSKFMYEDPIDMSKYQQAKILIETSDPVSDSNPLRITICLRASDKAILK